MNPNWNPNYDQVAKAFVPQYYAIMDGDKASRIGLANFYSVSIQWLQYFDSIDGDATNPMSSAFPSKIKTQPPS